MNVMGYEAREDARSEYNAQILAEGRDTDFDEHVGDAIESGDFDTEVLERALKIMDNFCAGSVSIRSELKQIIDCMGQEEIGSTTPPE